MNPPETPQARIVIVDDQETNVDVLVAMLDQAGYTNLTTVTDSRQAARTCRLNHPDLVLLDLHMPHLDGFAVMAELKRLALPGDFLPVLVLTADCTIETRRRALEAGAQDFLSKPFDRTEVLLRVRNLLHLRAMYRNQQERHSAVVALVSDLTVIRSDDGTLQYVSPSFEHILGYAPEELRGASFESLLHPDDELKLLDALAVSAIPTGTFSLPPCRIRHRDGSWHALEARATNSLDDPAVRGVVITARDVSALTVMAEALEVQARFDSVTGLPNREHLMRTLKELLDNGPQTAPSQLALLLIDLQGLHKATEVLAPSAVDALLKEAAKRVKGLCRPQDVLTRIADTQFAMVLPAAKTASAIWSARKVLTTLGTPITSHGVTVYPRGIVGIALGPEDGSEFDTLVHAASVALTAAAGNPAGYNQYSSSQEVQAVARWALTSDLRFALAHQQLALYYQPKVDLLTEQVYGVEALARWDHPEHGRIPPDQFIALAEQTGMIDTLTAWAVEAALQQSHAWHAIGLDLEMAVNISMRSLADPQLPRTITRQLQQYGLPPQKLVLEITESALTMDEESVVASLARLAALGVRLSIDDFGTGHASLAALRRMPLSEVKIDRSFVMSMHETTHDRAVVESVVSLGHKLDLRIVAEGVDNLRTLRLLREVDCDSAQGYYFTAPLPAVEFKRWLDRSRWGMKMASH